MLIAPRAISFRNSSSTIGCTNSRGRIVRRGLYRHETFVGVEEDGKTIILEGNRRLAALKLLIAPEQAAEADVKRFRRLARDITPHEIKKVAVLIAPDREAAAPLIIDKHTRAQIARWSPIQQANYFRALTEDGLTPQELQDHYGIPPGEVVDFLRRNLMYRIACSLELPEAVKAIVQNPRAFPSTTLDRLIDNPEVLEFLGAKFDEKHGLVGSIPKAEFVKGYTKLVTDVATGEIDSRALNNTDKQKAYLAGFGKAKPDKSKKGRFTAKDVILGSAPTVNPTQRAERGPTQRVPKLSPSVIPRRFKCMSTNRRIRAIFDELKKMNAERHPNASALMLRLLLELALGRHFALTKKDKILEAQAPPNRPGGREWSPSLSGMLKYVVQHDTLLHGQPLAALRKFVSGQHTAHTLENMNSFVHNHLVTPTSSELHGLWATLEPLFVTIFPDPPETS
jgi:hypothetical protein